VVVLVVVAPAVVVVEVDASTAFVVDVLLDVEPATVVVLDVARVVAIGAVVVLRTTQLQGVWCSTGSVGSMLPGVQLDLQLDHHWFFSKHVRDGSLQHRVL